MEGKAYYTDGYGFSESAFTTEDRYEIETLWDDLNLIEAGDRVDEDITDWYPQVLFTVSDGTTFGVRFDAHWLEIGGKERYALSNDAEFWGLTEYLVVEYAGE